MSGLRSLFFASIVCSNFPSLQNLIFGVRFVVLFVKFHCVVCDLGVVLSGVMLSARLHLLVNVRSYVLL